MTGKTAVAAMAAVMAAGVLAAPWARAQQGGGAEAQRAAAPEDRAGWVTRFYDLRHGTADGVAKVLQMFFGRTNVDAHANRVIWSGPPALAPAVDDAVRRLDVAPPAAPSIELTFHILRGVAGEGAAGTLPPDLEGVAKQLRAVFGVGSIGVLESALLRVTAGRNGWVEGRIAPWTREILEAQYMISFGNVEVTEDAGGASVRVPTLSFELPILGGGTGIAGKWSSKVKLATSIEVRDGQKAVVGKASVDRTEETIVLVVVARVVE